MVNKFHINMAKRPTFHLRNDLVDLDSPYGFQVTHCWSLTVIIALLFIRLLDVIQDKLIQVTLGQAALAQAGGHGGS